MNTAVSTCYDCVLNVRCMCVCEKRSFSNETHLAESTVIIYNAQTSSETEKSTVCSLGTISSLHLGPQAQLKTTVSIGSNAPWRVLKLTTLACFCLHIISRWRPEIKRWKQFEVKLETKETEWRVLSGCNNNSLHHHPSTQLMVSPWGTETHCDPSGGREEFSSFHFCIFLLLK